MNQIRELKEIANAYSVLYVEDDKVLNESVTIYLKKFFQNVQSAFNGKEGLELFKKNKHDLIISDIEMPVLNGIEMAKEIKKINPNQNILVISAYTDTTYFTESIKIGIDGYIIKPIDYHQMNDIIYKILFKLKEFHENELYKNSLELLVDQKTQQFGELQEKQIDNHKQTLIALVDMIEQRDTYTGGHSQRVARYSHAIAKALGVSEKECDILYQAGILHDIGKIAIPDSILLKPHALNDIEYRLIKEHVTIGYEMLKKIAMFEELAEIMHFHHERYDGSGYPEGIQKDEIPFLSQIMAIADSFDAMTTSRIYKPRKSKQEALNELNSLKGVWFDEKIVTPAVKVLGEISIDSDINQLPQTEIEKERFSYFYRDQVSGAYNKEYLDLSLIKNRYEQQYDFIELLFLHRFTNYNRTYSWEKGDEILKKFADDLKESYPNATIFRIHGDDFALLSREKLHFPSHFSRFEKTGITLSTKVLNIKEHNLYSFDILEKVIIQNRGNL